MHNIRKVLSILYALVSAWAGCYSVTDWVVIGGASRFYEPYFGITEDNTMQGRGDECGSAGVSCRSYDSRGTGR